MHFQANEDEEQKQGWKNTGGRGGGGQTNGLVGGRKEGGGGEMKRKGEGGLPGHIFVVIGKGGFITIRADEDNFKVLSRLNGHEQKARE
jgi:hypothetical protein